MKTKQTTKVSQQQFVSNFMENLGKIYYLINSLRSFFNFFKSFFVIKKQFKRRKRYMGSEQIKIGLFPINYRNLYFTILVP